VTCRRWAEGVQGTVEHAQQRLISHRGGLVSKDLDDAQHAAADEGSSGEVGAAA
jgi:hypothetical protein